MEPEDPGEIFGRLFLYKAPPGMDDCGDLPTRKELIPVPGLGSSVRPYVHTAWVLTDDERRAVADGARILLSFVSRDIAPMQIQVEGLVPYR